MMLKSLLPALALLPGFALADCPTKADLADGVTLVQNQPFFMRSDFQTVPEGFVENRIEHSTGAPRQTLALYAHGLVMIGEHNDRGLVQISYEGALAEIDNLPVIGKVSLPGTATGPAGETPVTLQIEYQGTGEATLADDCTFETWQLRTSLLDSDGKGAAFETEFAPSLGIVLAAAQLDDAGNATLVYGFEWAGTKADLER